MCLDLTVFSPPKLLHLHRVLDKCLFFYLVFESWKTIYSWKKCMRRALTSSHATTVGPSHCAKGNPFLLASSSNSCLERKVKQTKQGREGKREDGESVRRLNLHSNGQKERWFISVIISNQTFPAFTFADNKQTCISSVPWNVFLFLNTLRFSSRHDKPPLLFSFLFHSKCISITRKKRKHCYLHSTELFLKIRHISDEKLLHTL